MNIYVAAHRQDQGVRLAEQIFHAGFDVCSTWVNARDYGLGKLPEDERDGLLRSSAAQACVSEIRQCDLLVLLSGGGFGGRHVEMGVALALGKPVHLIGPRENVFHWHPGVTVHVDTALFLRFLEKNFNA